MATDHDAFANGASQSQERREVLRPDQDAFADGASQSQERREMLRRLAGFAAVSVVAVPVAQLTLWLCYGVIGIAAVPANIIAVAVGAVPSYWLNRRWVWQKAGGHSVSREILPFWTYTFLGLALSTLFVAIADRVWGTSLAVALANISGFGVLWIGKFILLERVLFADQGEQAQTT
jgi:putative flippase GtrA